MLCVDIRDLTGPIMFDTLENKYVFRTKDTLTKVAEARVISRVPSYEARMYLKEGGIVEPLYSMIREEEQRFPDYSRDEVTAYCYFMCVHAMCIPRNNPAQSDVPIRRGEYEEELWEPKSDRQRHMEKALFRVNLNSMSAGHEPQHFTLSTTLLRTVNSKSRKHGKRARRRAKSQG
jgi:hypothetical protein